MDCEHLLYSHLLMANYLVVVQNRKLTPKFLMNEVLDKSHLNYLKHLFRGSSVSILHHCGLINLSSILCSALDEN